MVYPQLVVEPEAMEYHIGTLQDKKYGFLGEGRVTRPAWSKEESNVIEHFKDEAERIGLKTRYDGVGNAFSRTNKGKSGNVVLVGSHHDSVRDGGQYDGTAGEIMFLEAIRALVNSELPLTHDVAQVAWRGEEGDSFDAALKGSQAAIGRLEPRILKKTCTYSDGKTITLEEAIRRQGFEPGFIEDSAPSMPHAELSVDEILYQFESHIEQASSLVEGETDIGIVTSVPGNLRRLILIEGEVAHSGSTPIDQRISAITAISYVIWGSRIPWV